MHRATDAFGISGAYVVQIEALHHQGPQRVENCTAQTDEERPITVDDVRSCSDGDQACKDSVANGDGVHGMVVTHDGRAY